MKAASRGLSIPNAAERCVAVPLLGNHEAMMLAACEGQSDLRYWLRFGGTEALASFGHRGGPRAWFAVIRREG
jgi:hypothetical protein